MFGVRSEIIQGFRNIIKNNYQLWTRMVTCLVTWQSGNTKLKSKIGKPKPNNIYISLKIMHFGLRAKLIMAYCNMRDPVYAFERESGDL